MTKEVIQKLTSERLQGNDQMIGLQNEIQSQRFQSMLQRQKSAVRQARLNTRLNEMLARDIFDDDLSEFKVERDIRGINELSGRHKLVPGVWSRMNDMQLLLSHYRVGYRR